MKKKINEKREPEFTPESAGAINTETVTEEKTIDRTEPVTVEPTESAKDEIEKIFDSAEQPKEEPRKRKRKEAEPEKPIILIPGELVVEICGNISGGAVHWIDGFLSKEPVPIQYLVPREDQVKRLAPLAEKFIEALKIQTDPVSAFIVAMTATTFTNYILVKAMQTPKKNDNPA